MSRQNDICAAQKEVNVSRLDLRVGLITSAKKHPTADSLYVEDILCGEEAPRVVVSGLVNHIPEPEMQQRLVVVIANLKPANLKSIKSHAMVLAATSTDGKVRQLDCLRCGGFLCVVATVFVRGLIPPCKHSLPAVWKHTTSCSRSYAGRHPCG